MLGATRTPHFFSDGLQHFRDAVDRHQNQNHCERAFSLREDFKPVLAPRLFSLSADGQ